MWEVFLAGVAILLQLRGCHAGEVMFGDIRLQALSSTLFRIEPKGPMGFEDRSTFTVVETGRQFKGIPIKKDSDTSASTADNKIMIKSLGAGKATQVTISNLKGDVLWQGTTGGKKETCLNARTKTDAAGPVRTSDPCVVKATQDSCCAACDKQDACNAWVWAGGPTDDKEGASNETDIDALVQEGDPPGTNCWLLSSAGGTKSASGRVFGSDSDPSVSNHLNWPAPLKAKAYALEDFPRFYSPPWGPTPIPNGSHVDPAVVATNGYDFRNNVKGDIYIFLLGTTMENWQHSREEFIQLAGPTPLLPDFAWGTWFTYWHSYTEKEAKGEIERWESDKLPIDVWALDMNWRETKNNMDRTYNHPNTQLFPDFSEWFTYLESKKLRTYFNDHPYPVDAQTSKAEVDFRWQGLSEWMEKGLTYWWFDHNWGFSIPPPFVWVPGNHTGGDWDGLDNCVWGSHLYHTTVEVFDKTKRPKDFPRSITLTKFAPGDQRPGMVQHEHPAQHRYPVWWTGDGVNLEASVQSMVDSGMYDFKPYVHSDCGGDYRGSAGDLLRWTAHCAFGSILRFHGNQHQPWSYDTHTEDVIRQYLNMRYKLIPSLISAGQAATQTGVPIVARGDFFWPEHGTAAEAASNHQYVHLTDTLVAPIYDTKTNQTSRSVWIPPGSWQDAWSGSTVTGPKTITVTQPFERIPMWHKKGGSLLVTTPAPGLRVDDQDWSVLCLEAFVSPVLSESVPQITITRRAVHNLGSAVRTNITMRTDGASGFIKFDISKAEDAGERGWVLRLHLHPGQQVESAVVDGVDILANVSHLQPLAKEHGHQFFPFGGPGTAPAPNAGPVAEIFLESSAEPRTALVKIKS